MINYSSLLWEFKMSFSFIYLNSYSHVYYVCLYLFFIETQIDCKIRQSSGHNVVNNTPTWHITEGGESASQHPQAQGWAPGQCPRVPSNNSPDTRRLWPRPVQPAAGQPGQLSSPVIVPYKGQHFSILLSLTLTSRSTKRGLIYKQRIHKQQYGKVSIQWKYYWYSVD